MNPAVERHFRYVLGIDGPALDTLYESFLATFSECVEKLKAAVDPPDFIAIRAATHTIKGFAENVGAPDLAEAAAALNAAAHAADPAACAVGVQDIVDMWKLYDDGSDGAEGDIA